MISTHLIRRHETKHRDMWLTITGRWSVDRAEALPLAEHEAAAWLQQHEAERRPGERWEMIVDE